MAKTMIEEAREGRVTDEVKLVAGREGVLGDQRHACTTPAG
jgi:thiamine biosynthesis protein ThiC